MNRNELVELTVLCMIYNADEILLQNRIKEDWHGFTFPGGHIEKNESFIHAAIREMKEETGLDIYAPTLCGVEQFKSKGNVRYIVLLLKTNCYSGILSSSTEGEMLWVKRTSLKNYKLANTFWDILHIFDNDEINELFYSIGNNNEWIPEFY